MMEVVFVMVMAGLLLVGLYTTAQFFRKGLNELLQDQFGVDTLDEYKEMMLSDI